MAKVREQDKYTIPSDWDEETDGFQLLVMCVPNSRQWRGIVIGQISDLVYGRRYNKLTGTIKDAQAVARDIFESVNMMCMDDLVTVLQCLCDNQTILAEKTGTIGQEIAEPKSDGEIEVGPGKQFPDQEAYFNAKCNVSNGIFDTIREFIFWMKSNDGDLRLGTFGGLTTGLLVGVGLAGPAGWAWALLGGLIASIAGYMLRFAVSFVDLLIALDEVKTEAVLALYNASNTQTAEDNFLIALDNATQSITTIEREFIELLLTSELLNQLFSPRADLADYASPAPVDCGSNLLILWDFDADQESWTFQDDSTANASATGSYDAAAEALLSDQIIVAGGTQRTTIQLDISPTVSQAVTVGAAIQADFAAPSDGVIVSYDLTAIYDDAREFNNYLSSTAAAGTNTLSLTEAGTLERVEIETRRSNGGSTQGFTFDTKILEVRVLGA